MGDRTGWGRCGCPRRGTRTGDFAPGWIGSGGVRGVGLWVGREARDS